MNCAYVVNWLLFRKDGCRILKVTSSGVIECKSLDDVGMRVVLSHTTDIIKTVDFYTTRLAKKKTRTFQVVRTHNPMVPVLLSIRNTQLHPQSQHHSLRPRDQDVRMFHDCGLQRDW